MDAPAESGETLPAGALFWLWVSAIIAGLGTIPVVLFFFGALTQFETFPAIIAAAWGGMVFGGVFYLGVNVMGVAFERQVQDVTHVSGASVEHITEVETTGDDIADRWLGRYVLARTVFGGFLVPVTILMGLVWFG